MIKKLLIGLTLTVFCVLFAFPQRISPEIISISETQDTITIDFNLPNYQVTDTNIYEVYGINQNFKFISVSYDLFGITWDVGYPCLPQLTINLSVPNGASNFLVSSSNLTIENLSLNYPILPSQEDPNDSLPYSIDQNYYQSNGSLFPDTAILSDPFLIMGKDGISLTIFPFKYNPSQNLLTIFKKGKFKISYSSLPTPDTNKISITKEAFVNEFFQNYTSTNSTTGSNPSYLIITAPIYESTLTYFVNYKKNTGYDVTIVNTNYTGASSSNIKDYINYMHPDYVLLVGDISDIPTYGTTDGSDKWDPTTDLEYARLDGNDYFPDVHLGRFSVSNTTELQNIINKTIFMEVNRNQYGNNAKFLSGKDDNNWMSKKFEEGHDNVIDGIFIPLGYDCEKIYAYSQNNNQTDAINALNDNPIFFLYSGHGSFYSLAGGGFSLTGSNINTSISATFPLGFSFACKSGNFGVGNCYGEAWLRSNKGGVSYFGCSVTSLALPDVKLENSLFLFMPIYHIGPVIDCGKISFWILYHSATNNKRWKRYMKSYNLLGDPSFNFEGIGCINEYIFSNNEVFHDGDKIDYNASDKIIAAENGSFFDIQSGATANLTAGNVIELKPGFHSEVGSNFSAKIETCEGKSNAKISSSDSDTFKNSESVQPKTDASSKKISNIKVYPNPFYDNFNIEYSLEGSDNIGIEIYDVLGNNIYSHQTQKGAGKNIFEYDGSKLSKGLYIVKIKTTEYKESLLLLKMYN
jgi:hypothetical protein